MGFEITLTNVLVTLFYIIPGFFVCKMKKACADHLSTMSGVLVYGLSPFMVVSSLLALDCTRENLINMGLFFIVTFLVQLLFMLFIFLATKKRGEDPKYRLMTIASVLGNVGFFGLPIVKAIMPDNPEVMSYSVIYIISMNILVFTIGVFCLTGKKEFISLRAAVINPTVISFAVGFPLYLFGVGKMLPSALVSSMSLLGNMTTPLCMIILGVRLATVSLRKLFERPVIYLICLGKLILFPLFAYLCVAFLPLPLSFRASVLILSAAPCASVIFNLSELHRVDAELAANCVLLSTLLCFLTMPALTLLL